MDNVYNCVALSEFFLEKVHMAFYLFANKAICLSRLLLQQPSGSNPLYLVHFILKPPSILS